MKIAVFGDFVNVNHVEKSKMSKNHDFLHFLVEKVVSHKESRVTVFQKVVKKCKNS